MKWEVVIGLETHVQLATQSKIFSGASTAFGAAANTQACAVDLALPGSLPVLNRGAVECAIKFGLAVGAKIAPESIFARKNYFYPDLPKGYQISQYEIPVVQGGTISFLLDDQMKTVQLTRAHMEEDAGKSLHEDYAGMTGIDLNRAGTPLLEIVTEPDMRSSKEAVAYAKALHSLVMWLGICDGNMQEGSFRCDANVSVRPVGQKEFGTRREIKNLNSFRFMQQAIDYEVQWQIETLEDGGRIEQATVLFNPDTGETRAMRTKEDAHDYRYFPDPDLLPVAIAAEWIATVKSTLPELPGAMRERFINAYKLSEYEATTLTTNNKVAFYFEKLVRETYERAKPILSRKSMEPVLSGVARLCAVWMMGEFMAVAHEGGDTFDKLPITIFQFADLLVKELDGEINRKTAKDIFALMWDGECNGDPDAIIEARGLKQISDTGAIEKIIDEVLAANAPMVAEFKSGKEKAFNALVGQCMKATKGKANPAQVNALLKAKLTS